VEVQVKRFFLRSFVVVFTLAAAGFAQGTKWTGFYIGINTGAARGISHATTTTIFSPTGYFAMTSPGAIAIAGAQRLRPSGFSGGAQIGFDFQISNFVLGAETDFGAMDMNDSRISTGIYPCCAPTGFTVRQSVRTNWLFTARPRVGVTAGPVLIYATGGWATTHTNYDALFIDTFATAHENAVVKKNLSAGTFGGGAEVHFTKHWSLKGEYLYANFGTVSTTSTNLTAFTPLFAFPTNVWTHSDDLKMHLFRAGVNFRF
jgi:outer membrane immunogenic protein